MNKFRNNEHYRKEPTYLLVMHDKLPGITVEIPINRKARHMAGRKDKKFYKPVAFPLVKVPQGFFRTKEGDNLWQTSRRDLIRFKASKIGRVKFKQKMDKYFKRVIGD